MEGLLPVFCLCTWARKALREPGAKPFEMVEMGCRKSWPSLLILSPNLPSSPFSILHILRFSLGASLAAVSGDGYAGGLCPWFIFLVQAYPLGASAHSAHRSSTSESLSSVTVAGMPSTGQLSCKHLARAWTCSQATLGRSVPKLAG